MEREGWQCEMEKKGWVSNEVEKLRVRGQRSSVKETWNPDRCHFVKEHFPRKEDCTSSFCWIFKGLHDPKLMVIPSR